jgi:hypothetical protein
MNASGKIRTQIPRNRGKNREYCDGKAKIAEFPAKFAKSQKITAD